MERKRPSYFGDSGDLDDSKNMADQFASMSAEDLNAEIQWLKAIGKFLGKAMGRPDGTAPSSTHKLISLAQDELDRKQNK